MSAELEYVAAELGLDTDPAFFRIDVLSLRDRITKLEHELADIREAIFAHHSDDPSLEDEWLAEAVGSPYVIASLVRAHLARERAR